MMKEDDAKGEEGEETAERRRGLDIIDFVDFTVDAVGSNKAGKLAINEIH